jgi:hypothetical protein
MMKFGVDNAVKPILIVTVDGGPDENPQHQKVIETSIIYFLPDNLFLRFIHEDYFKYTEGNKVSDRDLRIDLVIDMNWRVWLQCVYCKCVS